MIFNIFLKLKEKLLLSGKLKLKVFSRYFATIFRPNWSKKLGYISKFTHFKLLNRLNTFIFFLVLWSNKKIQIFIFIFHSWETPPPLYFSIFLNTDQIAQLYIDASDA